MKVSKFLPMVLFLGVLSFSSCNDDDEDDDPTPPTKTELLTARNWMMTGFNVAPAILMPQTGTPETNLIPFEAACNLDDFWDLNTDGSYTREEGASKCSPNDPTVFESGDWLWNSDNTRLIFEPNGAASYEAKVISLIATELVLELTSVEAGVTYTFTQTFN
ncbi:MAG: hypothetical protein WBG42_10915 [Cryomorphaceae bacterium]